VILRRDFSREAASGTYLDPLTRQVVFDAMATHERAGPEAFLAPFHGDLHADAYTGYDALYATGRIREIGCWAHTRRGFVEALTTDVRAALMVALIQQLYHVERAGTDLSVEARQALRREQSIPLLAKIATERDALARTVLPKSPLGDAVRYLTNQWDALQRFVEDGSRHAGLRPLEAAQEQRDADFGASGIRHVFVNPRYGTPGTADAC
jgi:hypothetical protein